MKIKNERKKYTCEFEYEGITYYREEYDSETDHWVEWKFWKDADWHFLDYKFENEMNRNFRNFKKNKIRKDKLIKIQNL